MVGTRTIRVALVDDHAIVRQGLRALLSRDDIEIVGEGDCGPAAVEIAREQQPDVMLLDIRMKGGDGLQCLPQIQAVAPDTRVIMLTTYANPGYLARSIHDGAVGYLSKDVDPIQVLKAVRAVAAGEELIDRALLRAALSSSIDDSKPSPEPSELPVEELSEREVEVLRLVASGLSNAAIADTLHLSISTVKTHLRHILEKLHVSDRTQAALWAVRNNITS
jgi:two-component system, NarL family, response regulator LiaR